MSYKHIALAVAIAIIWGFNFVVIHLGLHDVPPLLLCLGRFVFSALPVFFIPFPRVPKVWVFFYGLFTFALQFSFLFVGMQCGISAGVAALLMQVQVFFTVLLAVCFLKERVMLGQVLGGLISFGGLGILASHVGQEMSALGFVLVLGAAISWAVSNVMVKKVGKVNTFGLVVWGSFLGLPVLLPVTLFFEGGTYQAWSDLSHFSWTSAFALLYIVVLSTWFAYAAWNYLFSKYSVVTIAPFTLLVPVCSILSSHFVLGESLPSWKILASAVIIAGLLVNLVGPWVRYRRRTGWKRKRSASSLLP